MPDKKAPIINSAFNGRKRMQQMDDYEKWAMDGDVDAKTRTPKTDTPDKSARSAPYSKRK